MRGETLGFTVERRVDPDFVGDVLPVGMGLRGVVDYVFLRAFSVPWGRLPGFSG